MIAEAQTEARLNEAQETDAQALADRIVAFMGNASTEIAPHDEPRLAALPNYLAIGARVYVAHPPSASLSDVVRVAGKLQAQGFRAVKVQRSFYEDSGEDAFLMQYRLADDVGDDTEESVNRIAQFEES